MLDRTTTHPADRVREAETFPEALSLLAAGYRYEASLLGDKNGFWARQAEKAERARAIYRDAYTATMIEAERTATALAVAKLREAGHDDYADALESGDFGGLAF